MKDGIKKIVGKTIEGVVVTKSRRSHVFLIFSDQTYFELWATDVPRDIQGGSDLREGGREEVKRYTHGQEIVLEVHDNSVVPVASKQMPTPPSVENSTKLSPKQLDAAFMSNDREELLHRLLKVYVNTPPEKRAEALRREFEKLDLKSMKMPDLPKQ